LADALSARDLTELQRQRDALLADVLQQRRSLLWRDEGQILPWYADKVERLLDAGHGACRLLRSDLGEQVAEALRAWAGQRYDLAAWVVMPNHLHVVVQPYPGHRLSQILRGWKSTIARQAKRLCRCEPATFWHKDSLDHWIGDATERACWVAYVEDNPVKAGLCAWAPEWRWSSAHQR